MYSFRQDFTTGTAEQVTRAAFYQAAMDAAVAQKASRRADSKLLSAALDWAITLPDLEAIPDCLRPWGPDREEAIPAEPPSGDTGKEASRYFRELLGRLENWPRKPDGTPVGPESVTRRPSAGTVEFLASLPEEEAEIIKALAAAAVRFGDRTRQKAASGSRKAGAATDGENDTASGSLGPEGGKAGQRPDFTGLDPLAAAAAALQWAAEAAAEAARLAEAAATTPGAPDAVKEASSFAAKAAKMTAKAASLAKMQ